MKDKTLFVMEKDISAVSSPLDRLLKANSYKVVIT
jgi:hypothetical protein